MFMPSYDGKDPVSMLFENRQIFINGEITAQDMDYAVAQVLALNAEDPDSDIYLLIDSPGGEINAGLALYNACQYVSNDIVTIGVGMCASMGSFLLSSGTKGKRFSFKEAEFSGMTIEEIEKLTDRDNFMSPEKALELGFIDRVITTQKDMADYLESLNEDMEE